MIYAKALRSKYPRARVDRVDVSKALEHPACVTALTAKDVPFNKTGHLVPDWDVLIAEGDNTRYVGDAIALVATTERNIWTKFLLVEVDYTELEPVVDPLEALKPDAPSLHPTEMY